MQRSSAGQPVYVIGLGQCLPNAPVGNDDIERILGMVGGRPSRARRLTLRNNGIATRHYAIDPQTLQPTHNNAQLTADAVRAALAGSGWTLASLDLLCCGTSSPDQLKPAHANMVHGELGGRPLEAITTAGVCSAGVAALKYGALSIRAGEAERVACTGSELASSFMLARHFNLDDTEAAEAMSAQPELAFEKDFLRWMLSDGAGCALLASAPAAAGLSLRIDWIDALSLANEAPVCMTSGAIRMPDGRLRGWREAACPMDIVREQYFAVKQDARLLIEYLPRLVARPIFERLVERRGLDVARVDWFVPHYSSDFFRDKLAATMAEAGFEIPSARWFSNLATVGNVGSASIYLMLEALMRSGRLERGQQVLGMVPESARFSVTYLMMTVV